MLNGPVNKFSIPNAFLYGNMADSMIGRDIEILLIEPDPAEGRRATAVLEKAKVPNHVTTVTDGAEALAHLRRDAHHYRSPRPNLIVLSADSLPGQGEELLQEIKCDPKLAHIPVVFFRSGQSDPEVGRVYDLNANCFLHKPLDPAEIERVLEIAGEFWLGIAKLPLD